MAARAEVDLDDMEAYPFASFESGVSVSVEFSEEVLFSSLNAFTKRIYVVDRGTMINTLTHTDAFSIGTGILSEGFAGPELVSRPIRGHQREIHPSPPSCGRWRRWWPSDRSREKACVPSEHRLFAYARRGSPRAPRTEAGRAEKISARPRPSG